MGGSESESESESSSSDDDEDDPAKRALKFLKREPTKEEKEKKKQKDEEKLKKREERKGKKDEQADGPDWIVVPGGNVVVWRRFVSEYGSTIVSRLSTPKLRNTERIRTPGRRRKKRRRSLPLRTTTK